MNALSLPNCLAAKRLKTNLVHSYIEHPVHNYIRIKFVYK